MKKIFFIILPVLIVVFFAPKVWAKDAYGINRLATDAAKWQAKVNRVSENKQGRLSGQLAHVNNLINLRTAELNKILIKVQNSSSLSSDDKIVLTNDVQKAINNLSALKNKVAAENDVTGIKLDIKHADPDLRIFSIFMPKFRLLIAIDNLSALQIKLNNLMPKLQNLINNLESQGKDVSSLQSLLDNINRNLQAINLNLNRDKLLLDEISVSGDNAKSIFIGVKQDLSNTRKIFAAIRQDIARMRSVFKIVINASNKTGTSSAMINTATSSLQTNPSQ